MENFTNNQNEIFNALFSSIKTIKNINFTTKAFMMINLDDNNFEMLFKDNNNTIVGSDEELFLINERAKKLGLIKE